MMLLVCWGLLLLCPCSHDVMMSHKFGFLYSFFCCCGCLLFLFRVFLLFGIVLHHFALFCTWCKIMRTNSKVPHQPESLSNWFWRVRNWSKLDGPGKFGYLWGGGFECVLGLVVLAPPKRFDARRVPGWVISLCSFYVVASASKAVFLSNHAVVRVRPQLSHG